MKKTENEILNDGAIEAVDEFSKEFDGIDKKSPEGIQEVWKSGLIEEDIKEQRAGDVRNRLN